MYVYDIKQYLIYNIDLETGYVTENTRELGLSVLRGTAIILISPFDGMEEIENPFAQ
jgi:U6 snRNA-associated Sm-like protein LSm7